MAIGSALLCMVPGAPVAASDPPQMVVDLRPGEGSDPGDFVQAGGAVYFSATDPEHGPELWRTDGTPEGTSLVADIRPGPSGSYPTSFVAYQDGVVFTAYDGKGTAIWRAGAGIDGAVRITRGEAWPLAVSGGRIFATRSGSSRHRLVQVDPVSGATQAVGDLGKGVHAIRYAFDVDGTLFFTVDRRSQARTELWATDGTDSGTRSLGRIGTTGEELSDFWPIEWMTDFTAFRSKLWFLRHWNSGAGCDSGDLWVSDGTRRGTRRAAEVLGRIGSCIAGVTLVGDRMFFSSYRRDAKAPAELWTTDGTRAGTSKLTAFRLGRPERLTALGDHLLFEGGGGGRRGLWTSDGTSAGTRLVGPFSEQPFGGLDPASIERAYLARGHELWVTDGTADGTGRLITLRAGPEGEGLTGLTRLGSLVVFAADDGVAGLEPWVSDGTPAGTRLVRDIDTVDLGSDPVELTSVDLRLYLSARDGSLAAPAPHLLALGPSWDPSEVPMVYEDIAEPASLTTIGRRVLLAARHAGSRHGLEPWVVQHDGPRGELKDIRPGRAGSEPSDLARMGFWVYFAATSSTGRDLWATNGTPDNTVLVRDLVTTKGGAPRDLVVAGDRLFLTSGDKAHGRELWTSDGTAAGTRIVADIRPGTSGSAIAELTAVGQRVYFRADDGVRGSELWASDGTRTGTSLVRDLRPGGGSQPRELTEAGGILYFTAADSGQPGSRLWSTDGTAEGTAAVAPAAGCEASGMPGPRGLAEHQGGLYFSASCGAGRELFRIDGVAEIPVQVADVNPNGDADPIVLGGVFGRLYFSADDGVHGRELWRTDGTPQGTELVGDVNASGSSDPAEVVPFLRSVYFTADDGVHGREVWSVAP